jgi:hypothetical protein
LVIVVKEIKVDGVVTVMSCDRVVKLGIWCGKLGSERFPRPCLSFMSRVRKEDFLNNQFSFRITGFVDFAHRPEF